MEGVHRAADRQVVRCYQVSRLEEELMSTAYERIWPSIQRKCGLPTGQGRQEDESSAGVLTTARRASA